ncbi:MarR family transcriptional regulator [Mycolicibacterium sp. 22603]|uniref:MarR family transcriptional regulator n=1 Tax=Mycolicibacterium sp. 22603 TaxID=3453950 RepID=UPI003F84D918
MKTKSGLIEHINQLIDAVGDKFEADSDGDPERDFLVARCAPRLATVVRELPQLSLHLLAALGEGPSSLVGLASRSGQLKGTVSKHVQRLVDAGLVHRGPVPGNRKETQLTLTDDGEVVVAAHRRLHEEMDRGRRAFLNRYTSAELQVVEKVLADLMAAGRDGVRIVADGA